jgi:hypothetical protein
VTLLVQQKLSLGSGLGHFTMIQRRVATFSGSGSGAHALERRYLPHFKLLICSSAAARKLLVAGCRIKMFNN